MKAHEQAKHPKINHRLAVITNEVNAVRHNHLPAKPMTPALLKVEVALSKAILLLDESYRESQETEKIWLEAYADLTEATRRETELPSGETQYWSSMLRSKSENLGADRLFDGKLFRPVTEDDVVNHALDYYEDLVIEMTKPYVIAGRALRHAFRLLASAAPKNFESRTAFVKRQGLASELETDGQEVFDKYLLSSRDIVGKRGFEPGFKATYKRFVAVWMSAPVEAKRTFIFAL